MASQTPTSIDSLLVSREDFRQGRPVLRGTRLTVHNIAAWHMRGDTVEDMCESNPDLDPSLFHAALAYYYMNKELIEADIERDRIEGEAWQAQYPHGITPETNRD